ncbi:hypothetical protein [Sodalis sp. dw_96]|uniref:hypothetical protein n=1 Tax=Sodalis sp. dw_96 TaxID=2719794 RepID=UPI001BD5ABBF|nr:hypothetical protein [Sodalis sp. dw_96]
MLIFYQKNHESEIEKELLSNSANMQEYYDAKHLFHNLKSIRSHDVYEIKKPVTRKKLSFKRNFVLRLLFASAHSPMFSFASNLTEYNKIDVNIRSQLNSDPFFSGADTALVYHDAYAATLAAATSKVSTPDGSSAEKIHRRRVARSAEVKESIYLPPATSAFDELISLLIHESLIQEEELECQFSVIRALENLLKHNDGLKTVARNLLKSSGFFGAKENEELSEGHQKKILIAWIKSYIFKDKVEIFLVNEFIKMYKNRPDGKFLTSKSFADHIFKSVMQLLKNPSNNHGEDHQAHPAKFITDNLLFPIMPTFYHSSTSEIAISYPVGSIEWGFMHVGLGLAMSAELDLKPVPENEILSLGIILETMLKEGLIDLSLIKLFIIPAMFHHVKDSLENNIIIQAEDIFGPNGIKQSILEDFFSDCNKYHSMNDPIMCLSQGLADLHSWTSIEEALSLISQDIKFELELPHLHYQSIYYKYCFYSSTFPYVMNYKKNRDWQMPDPNSVFLKQNADISNAFANIDKKVIYDVFFGISKEEADFLKASKVTLSRVSLENLPPPKNTVLDATLYQINDLAIRENVDVFSAEKNNDVRIYALIKERGEYRIKRVNEHITTYFEYLKYFRPEFDTDSIKLKFCSDDNKILKDAYASLKVLADKLSHIHRDKMLNHLNAYIYADTQDDNHKSFLSSRIPFYHCNLHEQIANEDKNMTECGLDVAALSSIAGKSEAEASIKPDNGLPAATGKIVSGFAVRQSLVLAMKNGASSPSRIADLPASPVLNFIALNRLALEYLRVFDPDLEITSQPMGAILEEIKEGAAIASQSQPSLNNLLGTLIAKKNDPFVPLRYEIAYLPPYGLKVPVVKLGGDRFLEKEIYLRINPENNDIFSRKYTLTADKNLVPVPMPQGKELHNFRPKVLFGMGVRP